MAPRRRSNRLFCPLMRSGMPDGFCSIPSATGGIARLACARLRELGKDVAAVLAEVGARPEQVNDDAIRLEVPKQIRILELASEELQDGLLGFHLARNFDLREIGLVYYVIASSERLADALLNGKRYSRIMNEGVRISAKLDDQATAIALDYVNVDRQSDRHQIECWLVTLVRICRQVTDTRLAPRHLRIRHRRDETPAEMIRPDRRMDRCCRGGTDDRERQQHAVQGVRPAGQGGRRS